MPLGSTNKTKLEEVAHPVWTLGEDGEPSGVEDNPVYVTGDVVIGGEDGDAFGREETTGALVAILVPHHEIHEGETYLVSYKTPDGAPLADDGTIAFAVTVAASHEAHMLASGANGGDMEGELREGVTWTGGTAMNIFNKKRSASGGATVTVVRDPTVTGPGTLIENEFVPGGSGPRAVGGAGGQRAEWILAPGQTYLFRITNRAGNNQPASLSLEWYEEGVA